MQTKEEFSAVNENGISERFELPQRPVVHIKAGSLWKPLNLAEIRQYHELLYFLVWRDVKLRYKQTLLGAIWAILQPLLASAIFTIVFGKLVGVPTGETPYFLFAFAGFLFWTFFSNSVTASGNSLVASSHLITKIYFPRLIIPIAAVFSGLVDLFFALILLVILMFWYKIGVTTNLILFVPIFLLLVVFASSLGILLSALNVKYRDIRFALPFLIQIWLFASPIIYPASLIPENWRFVAALNPLTGIFEGLRAALFNLAFDWQSLAISSLMTLFVTLVSLFVFRRMEKDFADII